MIEDELDGREVAIAERPEVQGCGHVIHTSCANEPGNGGLEHQPDRHIAGFLRHVEDVAVPLPAIPEGQPSLAHPQVPDFELVPFRGNLGA